MNYLKQYKSFVLLCVVVIMNMQAKTVESIETAYSMQAPQEIVNSVENVAQLMGFTDPYEIVVPKKAGIQINPWNKFVSFAINPQTKNLLIIVNPEWFSTIPQDQQQFLLGRYFMSFKHGIMPRSLTLINYAYIIFSLLLALLLFFILRRTLSTRWWVSLLAAFFIVGTMEFLFLDKLHAKLRNYYAQQHDRFINESVIEKTGNRDVAIQALEKLDSSIKTELSNGELFWAPYETLFEHYAQELKNNA